MAAMSKENERRSADFRQSTGACARAISRDASISLNFDDEAVDVDVDAAALPDIPADATPEERIRLRGRSDAIALHRQHHDAASHARLSYSNDVSNRCFGMAEQTRVELLGSKIFKGVEANLNAVLEQRYRLLNDAMKSSHAMVGDDQKKLGVEHALSLYLREQLGGALPQACQQALGEWREWLDKESKTDLQTKLLHQPPAQLTPK